MVFPPNTLALTTINDQAAQLLDEVKRALHGKEKAPIQVHLEVSVPAQERSNDVAKLLFYYQPRLLPNKPGHCFTDTYDVDQALRVNTAAYRAQNQYFIKLLTYRLGLRPFFCPGWEQGTHYSYTRYSSVSSPFSYKKLIAALQALAELSLTELASSPHAQRHDSKKKLRQELLEHFGVNYTAASHGNFIDQELCLNTRVMDRQPYFDLVAPKGRTFTLDKATYDYLTISESWDEDDYHHHHLSQISTRKFQAGAYYKIALSELLYILD
jgi:hypothetical protein